MSPLFFILTGYLLTRLALPLSLRTMIKAGLTAKNYQGVYLPFPAGLVPVSVFLLMLGLNAFWGSSETKIVFYLCLGLTSLGLWDDLRGTSDDKGFRGHLKAFLSGRISTGFLKAFVGGLLALWGAWALGERTTEHLLLNTLLIALLTNFFNLLDLRPGRAIKMFLPMAFLVLWLLPAGNLWLATLLGPIAAYFPWDLSAKGMLGDTGANLLGFVLGLSLVTLLGSPGKLALVVGLTGIQIYAEKFSITALIDKHPLLRYMDRWGRPDY